jgi:RNA polymerase sigma factor (sigma-70 family)
VVDADDSSGTPFPDDAPEGTGSSIPDPPPAGEIEQFFRTYWESLVRGLLAEGAKMWEAQDAVAEAIREALRRWPTLTNPAAWVRVAARSHWLKQRARTAQADGEMLVADVEQYDESRATDPGLTELELEEWFNHVLDQLPPARREALRLSAQGLTPAEIAALVGKTPEAVRTALKLGRRQAVELWEPDESGEDT